MGETLTFSVHQLAVSLNVFYRKFNVFFRKIAITLCTCMSESNELEDGEE